MRLCLDVYFYAGLDVKLTSNPAISVLSKQKKQRYIKKKCIFDYTCAEALSHGALETVTAPLHQPRLEQQEEDELQIKVACEKKTLLQVVLLSKSICIQSSKSSHYAVKCSLWVL